MKEVRVWIHNFERDTPEKVQTLLRCSEADLLKDCSIDWTSLSVSLHFYNMEAPIATFLFELFTILNDLNVEVRGVTTYIS